MGARKHKKKKKTALTNKHTHLSTHTVLARVSPDHIRSRHAVSWVYFGGVAEQETDYDLLSDPQAPLQPACHPAPTDIVSTSLFAPLSFFPFFLSFYSFFSFSVSSAVSIYIAVSVGVCAVAQRWRFSANYNLVFT